MEFRPELHVWHRRQAFTCMSRVDGGAGTLHVSVRMIRSRGTGNAPHMRFVRCGKGRGMYGVELNAAIRLVVVDEVEAIARRRGGPAPAAGR